MNFPILTFSHCTIENAAPEIPDPNRPTTNQARAGSTGIRTRNLGVKKNAVPFLVGTQARLDSD